MHIAAYAIDAARWHIASAHFQAMLWRQAHKTNPTLPLPETMGWTNSDDGKLVPKLMTLAASLYPKAVPR